MIRPPTAKDWVHPETDEEWEQHSKVARKRMGKHDDYPRDLRLFLYEVGDLPDHQMKTILANLKRNQVTVIFHTDGTRYVIRPDLKPCPKSAASSLRAPSSSSAQQRQGRAASSR
jgi:hypothetical protein